MRAYKITDVNDRTFRGFKWYEGKVHKTDGKGELCSSSFIHFYRDKRLAVLLNPIHGCYYPFHLWLGEAGGTIKEDNGLKWGCTEFRMIKRVSIPRITLTQKIAFGILCSLEVCTDPEYKKWAEGWLQNKDRTAKAAQEAAWATGATGAAAWAAAGVSARAARAVGAAAWAVGTAAKAAKVNLIRLATECLKY